MRNVVLRNAHQEQEPQLGYRPELHQTPWQKVHAKFGLNPAQLAKVLGRHRSKLSRALRDEKGLINGNDQELILKAASRLSVNITSDDLTPERK